MGIALYLKAKLYGLRLNYGATPTPAPAPSPTPTSIACSLSASSSTPQVGALVSLNAVCSGSPMSFRWTGCSSSTSTCTATSTTAGSVTYSVSASNGAAGQPPGIDYGGVAGTVDGDSSACHGFSCAAV